MKKKRPPILTQDISLLFGLGTASETQAINNILYRSHAKKGDLFPQSDALLWENVTKTLSPLKNREKFIQSPQKKSVSSPVILKSSEDGEREKHGIKMPIIPAPVVVQNLQMGKDILSDLGRGKRMINRKIDLHGMQQSAAYNYLKEFIKASYLQGERVVLVITGKGRNSKMPASALLRRLVPLWLESEEFQHYIAGFSQAHILHGGGGALYIHVKKR